MTSRILSLLGVLAVLAVSSPARQTVEDAFERGNTHFRAGEFGEAVRAYESILAQGLGSPEVYYNLGNAHYRLGNIGQAILAYERALRLAPGDPDIQHNLKLVNLRTPDRIEPVPELFLLSWLRSLASLFPLDGTAGLFAAVWGLMFLSLSVLSVSRSPAIVNPVKWVFAGSVVLVCVSGAMLALQVMEAGNRTDAIITAPVVTVKNSPDDQSVNAFVIHEGLKVHLGDLVEGWVQITLADGKVGWIREGESQRI